MNKSVKRLYEYKRSYDYVDFLTPKGKRITKRRAHRRLRQQFKEVIKEQQKD